MNPVFAAFEKAWNRYVDQVADRLEGAGSHWLVATPDGDPTQSSSVQNPTVQSLALERASRRLAERLGVPWARIDLDGYEPGLGLEALARYFVARRAIERDLKLELTGLDQLRPGADVAAWVSMAIDLAVASPPVALPATGGLAERIRALGRIVLFVDRFDELPAPLGSTLLAVAADARESSEGPLFVVSRSGPAAARPEAFAMPSETDLQAAIVTADRDALDAALVSPQPPEGAASVHGGLPGLLDALVLAGGRLPFQPLLDGVGLTQAEVVWNEDLIDTIDDRWVDELALLDDLEFHHPSFREGVYQLAAGWLPLAVGRQSDSSDGSRMDSQSRAQTTLQALADLPRTRGAVSTLARLAWAAGDERRARRLRCRLACWVVEAEAEALPAALHRAIAAGEFPADDLFRLVADGRHWPLGRRRVALEAWRTLPENDTPVRKIEALLLDGELERSVGRLESALASTRRAIELSEDTVGPASRSFVQALHQSAALLAEVGRLDDAREQIEWAGTLIAPLLPEDDRLRVAIPHTHGRILRGIGELRNAREPLQTAVEQALRQRGASAPEVALLRRELGALLAEVGELEDAEALYLETLDQTDLGPRDVIRAALLHDLAGVRKRRGESDGARDASVAALEQAERAFGPDDPQLLPFLRLVVDCAAPGDPRSAQHESRLQQLTEQFEEPIPLGA